MTEIRPRDVFQSLDLLDREQAHEEAIQGILSLLKAILRAKEADAKFSRVLESAIGQKSCASLTRRQRDLLDRLLDQSEFARGEMQARMLAGRVTEARDFLALYASRRGDAMNIFSRILDRVRAGQDAAGVGVGYLERGVTITELEVTRDPESLLMTRAVKTSREA